MSFRDAFRHLSRDTVRGQLLGLAFLAAIPVAFADPALDEAHLCQVASPQEAKSFADALYDKGEYQRAGECYQTAGNLARANIAFTRAVQPKGEVTGRALASQRDTAKSLIAGVQRAFRNNH